MHPMFMDWEVEYFKMSILPKLVHKFNVIITKILTPFLKKKKKTLKSKKKIHIEFIETLSNQSTLEKEARGPRIQFQTYYKATVIETMWY